MEDEYSQEYKYLTLANSSSIRLLERLPSSTADGQLSFRVRTRDLNEDGPCYHCLSYTWGNPFAHGNGFSDHFQEVAPSYAPETCIPIVLDGAVFYVHKNLHDALVTIPATAYADDLNRHTRDQGQTYFHYIGAQGRAEQVAFYVARGADVNLFDDNGRTALHLAALGGHYECVEALCKVGCLRSAKDVDGKTAEDLAREKCGGYESFNKTRHEKVVAVFQALAESVDPLVNTVEREPDGAERLIWVDAVCINQRDVEEKSIQVGMMDRIYQNSVYVVAWLGPPDEHTDLGLKTANTLITHLDEFCTSYISPWLGLDRDKYADAGVPHLPPTDWASLASIYQRQWFRRAWIIQEAILSPILLVYIGSRLVPWFDLGMLAQALRRQEAKLGSSISTRFEPTSGPGIAVEWNMAEMFQWRTNMSMTQRGSHAEAAGYEKLFALAELVGCFWTFRATDPKDKIFSVYGLINKFAGGSSGQLRHVTDYSRSVASVYTSATRQIMNEQGSLEILSHSLFSKNPVVDLPCWVPDYSAPAVNPIPKIFSASQGLELELPRLQTEKGNDDDPRLRLEGLRLGALTAVSGRQGTRPMEKFIFEPKWFEMVLALKDLPEGQMRPPLAELLWRTLCMDLSYGGFFSATDNGTKAPDEYRDQFTSFVLLMILALADRKVLEKNGIDPANSAATLSMFDASYDPFQEELASTLQNLDAIIARDLKTDAAEAIPSFMPPSELVVKFWNDIRCTMVRCTPVDEDGGPFDFTVPPQVLAGEKRCVGTGYVCTDSRMFRRCFNFSSAYSVAFGYRQLITLDELYLGVGPVSAQVGDEVWVLPGLTCPVVLRQATGEEKTFSFIGCCYLYGLMHGQAVEGAREKGIDSMEIELI
ncbi:hypothetical protein NQ176_g8252 [Zarea fungicola]|uniref:Uncharacterized protein n=1 Tax=Zarea fungicola TaxID=93591 RepID=A0ACC1MUG7_9HYPO|nr:hypothetical protein NQ176_g8252 [Lecanicillium fungicola]